MGTFQHTIDGKGRLSIPAKFREVLTAHSDKPPILTIAVDSCLALFPYPEWEAIQEKVKKSIEMNSSLRRFLRVLHSRAMPSPLDRQGRILISPILRKYAALEGETCVIGAENRVEIWNPDRWAAEEIATLSNSVDLQEKVAQLGI